MPAEPKAAGQRRRYLERKAARLCVWCKAGLTDDAKGVRCHECRDAIREHARTKRGRAVSNAATKRWRAKNAEVLRPLWRVDSNERYAQNRADGLCVGCSAAPLPGRVRCERCQAMNQERSRRYRANRRAA